MLDFLISPAYAQQAGPQPSGLPMMLMLGLVLVFMYFTTIRPQARRAKEHREMLAKLAKGDEVATTGGLAGKVADLGENFVTVEIADKVQVKVQRSAIASVLPKGTLKAA